LSPKRYRQTRGAKRCEENNWKLSLSEQADIKNMHIHEF